MLWELVLICAGSIPEGAHADSQWRSTVPVHRVSYEVFIRIVPGTSYEESYWRTSIYLWHLCQVVRGTELPQEAYALSHGWANIFIRLHWMMPMLTYLDGWLLTGR